MEVKELEDVYADFRETIEARRKELGLEKSKVAELAGISPQQFTNIMNGHKSPSARMMSDICKAVGVKMAVTATFRKNKEFSVGA